MAYYELVQLWQHACGYIDGFDAAQGPDTGGCDACDSGSDDLSQWRVLYRLVDGPVEIDNAALTAAYLAVEDELIELRDLRVGVIGPANGFIVKEKDGSDSPVMRLGTRHGLEIAIKAYLSYGRPE